MEEDITPDLSESFHYFPYWTFQNLNFDMSKYFMNTNFQECN